MIQEQSQIGIIEEVKPTLTNHMKDRVHYLSHHAVVRKEALTTKVRVVLDGSTKVKANASSLNECLHTGPSLTQSILDILLGFRWYKVALVSDIEKAFHMTTVDEQDRDALQFLSIDDIYATDPKTSLLSLFKGGHWSKLFSTLVRSNIETIIFRTASKMMLN